jgi:hypothetical protein
VCLGRMSKLPFGRVRSGRGQPTWQLLAATRQPGCQLVAPRRRHFATALASVSVFTDLRLCCTHGICHLVLAFSLLIRRLCSHMYLLLSPHTTL